MSHHRQESVSGGIEKQLVDCRRRVKEFEFYKDIVEHLGVGVFVRTQEGLVFVNDLVCEFSGYDRKELLGGSFLEAVHPEDRQMVAERGIARMTGQIVPDRYDFRIQHKLGHIIWVRLMVSTGTYQGQPAIFGNLVDITEKKRQENLLQHANSKLEGALDQTSQQLLIRSRELEEINAALKVLNRQSKQDTDELQMRVVANVEDLVMPYLERLADTPLNADQKVYLSVLNENLSQIVAPFMGKIGSRHANLTPREIEVANLVRMGKTSKQIANLLDISRRAVEFHRDSLRKKMGLRKSKKNLRAYLTSV
ncbi:MAG: PAS domain S-box protein [Desulfatibacillaceae bacterium]|nr:PAS domain S-box protein [Desulfatibacillaceae bacterium]